MLLKCSSGLVSRTVNVTACKNRPVPVIQFTLVLASLVYGYLIDLRKLSDAHNNFKIFGHIRS
jgi:hypothetical protein